MAQELLDSNIDTLFCNAATSFVMAATYTGTPRVSSLQSGVLIRERNLEPDLRRTKLRSIDAILSSMLCNDLYDQIHELTIAASDR